MKVKFPKGSEEWKMFMDFWAMTQELWGIEKTDNYWQHVRDEVETFAAKYGAFGISLGVALMDELKRRSEEKSCNKRIE